MKSLLLSIGICLVEITTVFAQPTDNVVAYYSFNGNANDVSGHGNNGTITNATPTTDRLVKSNAAYYFNGSNALICLPNALLPENTAFAFSCWVKILGNNSTGQTAQILIDLRGQYQVSLTYFQSNDPTYPGALSFYLYSSPIVTTVMTANNYIQQNTWYNVVCNYGNNSMELYVNGVLIGTKASNPPGTVSGYNNTVGKYAPHQPHLTQLNFYQ